jgi:hypothetical protein
MRVLSFDVGIKNLAGCILEWNETENLKSNLKIHYWDIINVVDSKKKEDEIQYKCLHTDCKMKVKAYIEFNNIKYCFCTRHTKDKETLTNHIFEPYAESKFTNSTEGCCSLCDADTTVKRKKTLYANTDLHITLCAKHYKQLITKTNNAQKKIISFKKSKVKDMTTNDLKLHLIKCLDARKNILLKDIDMVLIENQPTFKNPTMKSVSDTIYTWFMIRGVVDSEINNSTIKDVKFISPSNKLKEFNTETIEEAEQEQKYKITKKLSIENTKTILASYGLNDSINRILSFDKKDDLADSFLQGWYVLNSMHQDRLYTEWQTLYASIRLDVKSEVEVAKVVKAAKVKKTKKTDKNDKSDSEVLDLRSY